ncbi:MAG: excinuclease ABC subunit C [Parcubacteria bacterium C7867-005]|nr:MAG: excinuclease ABC subunit C [Parcubacteria bacterium C7867-005]
MNSQALQKAKLPDTPGVYFFLGSKKEILYIGKATSLKDRVKSYFSKDLIKTRGPRLVKMVEGATSIRFTETQSVLEALMLEAGQIKKHLPPYNTIEKDNKSFNSVIVTLEDYPRVLVIRSRNIEHFEQTAKNYKIKSVFGPFPSSGELREALKIIRKLFPYRDKCIPKEELKMGAKIKPCFNSQIGLCPGVCSGAISKREYRKRIKHLELFFNGEKTTLIKELEKEMKLCAKEERFEDAEKIKRTLYSLDHIQDVALIKRDSTRVYDENVFRIEAYDIAHISGSDTVGVMVVVEDDELQKSQYRKFKIKGVGGRVGVDDTKNLREVIRRRLGHAEWNLPQLIVVDGSTAQINAAKEELKERGFNIEIVSVVKDEKHKAREIIGEKGKIEKWGRSILLANSEAHRFAITYHRKLRSSGFRI